MRPSAMGRMARSTDPPAVEISGQARPARERVADRLGDGRFAGDGGELGPEPRLHRIEDRLGLGLADGLPCGRREAPDIALDGVEGADARERYPSCRPEGGPILDADRGSILRAD